MKIAGTPEPHESARGHVTGEALYTDDLCLRFPRVLHAWPVCAPHAHALVKAFDSTAAFSQAGVIAVLTGEDVPGEGDSGTNRHDEPLFPSEVMFHQQPVAWVLAETLEAARLGAGRVQVEYQPLDPILTIEQAIACASFLSGPVRMSRGDTAVIETSPLRFSGELAIGGQEHFYLETQSAIAWIDETGGISVESSTQHPSETQEVVARVLGLARNQVTVECLRMGGAFGGKEVQASAYAAIAALGAHKTGRPVRVRLTRALDMALTGKRHPFLARYTAGLPARRPHRWRPDIALFRWRLESRPFRAGALARDVSLRQRVLSPGGGIDRICLPHSQDLADGLPRIRRSARNAGHRRNPGPGGPKVVPSARNRARAKLLSRRANHALRPAGERRGAHGHHLGSVEEIQQLHGAPP